MHACTPALMSACMPTLMQPCMNTAMHACVPGLMQPSAPCCAPLSAAAPPLCTCGNSSRAAAAATTPPPREAHIFARVRYRCRRRCCLLPWPEEMKRNTRDDADAVEISTVLGSLSSLLPGPSCCFADSRSLPVVQP
eukprot:302910-Chlamydomonas_euryale.AAC.3